MPDSVEPSDPALPCATGTLRAVMHYRVGELWVEREQLGVERTIERDGRQVILALPTAAGSFDRASSWPLQGLTGSRMGEEGPQQLVCVGAVQVVVDLRRGLRDEGSGNAEMAFLREADEVAARVVRSFLDWARTHGAQAWLPPAHERPSPEGDAWLETASGDRLWSYPFRRPQGIVLLSHEWIARIGDLEGMNDEVLAGEVEPPVAESLLADARHAVWPTRDPDTQRAVLLAAIALETKTPEALRRVAGDDQRELLDLLLTNYEEVPTSVRFQLDQVAERVCGRSLKQADGTLLKRLIKLYKLRNEVAHRGLTPPVDEARDGVTAAEAAFVWLDGLTDVAAERPPRNELDRTLGARTTRFEEVRASAG